MTFLRSAVLGLVALLCLVESAGAEPKRILLINSFGHNFAPWSMIARDLRSELARVIHEPIDLYDTALSLAKLPHNLSETPFVDYLVALFANDPPDILITIGGPAATFAQRNRSRLFPSVPLVLSSVDPAWVAAAPRGDSDVAVVSAPDLRKAIEGILQVAPNTRTVAVVVGASPLERFWRQMMPGLFQSLSTRLNFVWLDDLPMELILARASSLPADSAIFYLSMAVDAAGIPFEEKEAIKRIRAAANAPIFSFIDVYFGDGVVGGPMISASELVKRTADVARRILSGEKPSSISAPVVEFATPKYDSRELERFGILEESLPRGSIVAFREPGLFERYVWYWIMGCALFAIQALFLLVLLVGLARLRRAYAERRHAEEAAKELSGRLISAHEEERSRLARELHDDISQQIAAIALDAGLPKRLQPNSPIRDLIEVFQSRLKRLSEDVHALSHRLHPSILKDIGLVEALELECASFETSKNLETKFNAGKLLEQPSDEIALCLYRVAQEALQNIAKHAKARNISVTLQEADGALRLTVKDDGIGFDPQLRRLKRSLGIESMRQRVDLVNGKFSLDSETGGGTTISVWIPRGSGCAEARHYEDASPSP